MSLLSRLRPKDGKGAGAMTALDPFFNPGAARAREERDRQHELVVPTPSPGDRLLDDGVVVIDVDRPAQVPGPIGESGGVG